MNIPPKLARIYQRLGSYHKTAEEIGVNVRYVYDLLAQGKEPPDRTARLRDIRRRLGLPRYRIPQRRRAPLSDIQKAIRQMAKDTHHALSAKNHSG